MFDFDKPEDGSEERYQSRLDLWTQKWIHTFWWLVHNCISHPLIGVCPITLFFQFHDWTSHRMNEP